MAINSSIICDTNVWVYFFDGHKKAGKIINRHTIMVSGITYIELLSNPNKLPGQIELIKDFLNSLTIIQTIPLINDIAINMRLKYSLDTPDAIIAATAQYLNIPLVTADTRLFKIKEIEVIKFSK